ncbi:hypothetical protein CCHR01_09535 [Colletotrichum chrysophilum]|uniref:Secreted protein n=1 Tax=Colletotrichum chrysophilum TaxID=1836956 RepID=A0AAD9AGK5_9PEZI|nr:hypothetical protein CCHR01_09535 [Colletotrichum chrysophilum]
MPTPMPGCRVLCCQACVVLCTAAPANVSGSLAQKVASRKRNHSKAPPVAEHPIPSTPVWSLWIPRPLSSRPSLGLRGSLFLGADGKDRAWTSIPSDTENRSVRWREAIGLSGGTLFYLTYLLHSKVRYAAMDGICCCLLTSAAPSSTSFAHVLPSLLPAPLARKATGPRDPRPSPKLPVGRSLGPPSQICGLHSVSVPTHGRLSVQTVRGTA